jgi:catechol 2,3-dioxygenase-like lactoylglutathione lyase family enzyme
MPGLSLFRVILPAPELDRSVAFFAEVFVEPGERVAPGRHYFKCGSTILALVDPAFDGVRDPRPNFEHVYFATDQLDAVFERVQSAGHGGLDVRGQTAGIALRPWGERSFYCRDPFGNPLCFVESGTEFLGLPQ